MQIAVLSDNTLKKELSEKGFPVEVVIKWVNSVEGLLNADVDVFMDLLFEKTSKRINCLAGLLPKPVFINAVTITLSDLGHPFIRINAWPGFLKRNLLEIAVSNDEQAEIAASILSACKWPYKLMPDTPGFVAARVVAMIVNEAYYALSEKVSTKAEIDLAMKLGTNYPYGPFTWSEHIGLENIFELLLKLSETNERYLIADALAEELQKKLE